MIASCDRAPFTMSQLVCYIHRLSVNEALFYSALFCALYMFNPLTPNDLYISRTTPLTSKRFILYIYSTNIGTEYFKHALYSPFFFSSECSLFHNANMFGSCIIHILYTECAEIKKKNNSGAKRLSPLH